MSLEIPELRVVPVGALVLHEYYDEGRVERLRERLAGDGVLRNPPVVASLAGAEDGRFVVLDGANRVSALHRLGVPHAVVQVVDYAEVRLHTWNHLLVQTDRERVEELLVRHGLSTRPMDRGQAERALESGEIPAYLDTPQGVLAVHAGRRPLQDLARFVESYRKELEFHRVKSGSLEELRRLYPEGTALVVFPRFRAERIVALTLNGERLPTGITRHVIPGRALRLNVPLEVLGGPESTAEKDRWLQEWVAGKLAGNQVRYYEESTYLFDE